MVRAHRCFGQGNRRGSTGMRPVFSFSLSEEGLFYPPVAGSTLNKVDIRESRGLEPRLKVLPVSDTKISYRAVKYVSASFL